MRRICEKPGCSLEPLGSPLYPGLFCSCSSVTFHWPRGQVVLRTRPVVRGGSPRPAAPRSLGARGKDTRAPPCGTLNGKGDTKQCCPRVSSECARHLDPPKGHSEQPREHRQRPQQRARGPLPATPRKSEASHLGPPRGPASQEDSPSSARDLFTARGRELAAE